MNKNFLKIIFFHSYLIKELLRTEKSPNANITKKGYLKLANALSNKEIRLFTNTDNSILMQKIGKVACGEFGFSDLNNVNPIKTDSIKDQFTNELDYLKFLNGDSIS